MATVTNYHQLDGLQQKFILSVLEAINLKQGVVRAVLPPEVLGKNPSLPLPASVGPGILWLVTELRPSTLYLQLPSHDFFLCLFLSFSVSYRYCIGFRAHPNPV